MALLLKFQNSDGHWRTLVRPHPEEHATRGRVGPFNDGIRTLLLHAHTDFATLFRRVVALCDGPAVCTAKARWEEVRVCV